MKPGISAREHKSGKLEIRFNLTGKGFDNRNQVVREMAKYLPAANAIGFTGETELTTLVDATPEACAPFAAFAESIGIEIVMM